MLLTFNKDINFVKHPSCKAISKQEIRNKTTHFTPFFPPKKKTSVF